MIDYARPQAVFVWRPYIDNPGVLQGSDRKAQCPVPQARRDLYNLMVAPLPAEWDPHSGESRFACVLVTGRGTVLDARLLNGSGRYRLDRKMMRVIRRTWRFELAAQEAPSPSWQRVRLSMASESGIVWDSLTF